MVDIKVDYKIISAVEKPSDDKYSEYIHYLSFESGRDPPRMITSVIALSSSQSFVNIIPQTSSAVSIPIHLME